MVEESYFDNSIVNQRGRKEEWREGGCRKAEEKETMADSKSSESTNLGPEKTPAIGNTQSKLPEKCQADGKSLIQECNDDDQVPREGMMATDLQPPGIEIGDDDAKCKKSRVIRVMDIRLMGWNPIARVGLGIYLGLEKMVIRIR
ncbi:hypothetical protein L6452_22671 [Arctium lappa]|uniref:Uncharacterized protein n=1 Tax=Arctium lappa TaxID=4217 RepID=A0ACB9B0I4_ARCLA|nr:hypothetical protein L6452_22671 [Arctium lappa]